MSDDEARADPFGAPLARLMGGISPPRDGWVMVPVYVTVDAGGGVG